MKREHLRAVVWPRRPEDGPQGKVYRYAVIGMYVSDKPLEGIEGFNETLLDSKSPGLGDLLSTMPHFVNGRGYPIGDATDALLCLGEMNFAPRPCKVHPTHDEDYIELDPDPNCKECAKVTLLTDYLERRGG